MTPAEYRPFDQAEKLGPPPWDPLDEKVALWERAHGHDVRLKCYEEFGCRVNEDESFQRGYGAGYRVGYVDGYRRGTRHAEARADDSDADASR